MGCTFKKKNNQTFKKKKKKKHLKQWLKVLPTTASCSWCIQSIQNPGRILLRFNDNKGFYGIDFQ